MMARGDRFLGSLLVAPVMTVYGLFVLWPVLQVCWLALQKWNGYGPQRFIGLANFATLSDDPGFRLALLHSLLWMLGAAVLLTALALLIALSAWRVAHPEWALAILFFPALLPATVVAAVWTLMFSPLHGFLDSAVRIVGLSRLAADWLGDPHLALGALFVAWVWSALGIPALLFWSALRAIGREYLDLAAVEGAGLLQRLHLVLLPGIRRTVVLAVLFEVALALAVFDIVFVTTGGGPGNATMLLSLDMYGRAFGGDGGQGAAVAVVQLLCGVLLAGGALYSLRGPSTGMDGDPQEVAHPSHLQALWLWIVVIVAVVPLMWLVVVALGGGDFSLVSAAPTLDPRSWNWGSVADVWSAGMGSAIVTSTLLACAATGLTVLLGVPAAFSLAWLPWSRSIRTLLLALLVLGLFQPTPVLIIPLFSLLGTLRLLDSPLGVLVPEVARTLPLAVLLLWAWMAALPAEILGAAAVDGASSLGLLRRIALPLSRPALIAAGILAFVSSWNEYLLPTVVSQDGSLQTVPTLLATFLGRFDTQYNLLAAGSLLALAPSLALYLVLRRPAARGLAPTGRRAR